MCTDKRLLLLNPGPVTLTERVRQALLGPDLCHREPEFSELMSDVRRRLEAVYPEAQEAYASVLLTGSGTAAVEAMVSSLVPNDGKALVVANGVYGERIAAMLAAHKKSFEIVQSAWTEPMNLAEVQQRLETGAFTHALAVHHETTTGRLNAIDALGRICHRHGVALLLDAVSSFGGEWIDFERWNVQACAATANKCLHGVPGVTFVIAKRGVLENGQSAANGLYLDLFSNFQAQANGSPQFTPAVQVMYALQAALEELEENGGWQRRHARYRERSDAVRAGLSSHGCELLLDDVAALSSILTAFHLPPRIDFDEFYVALKENGFVIYPGQMHLKQKIFRVAVMGDISVAQMQRFAAITGAIVRSRRGVDQLLAAPAVSMS